MTGPATRVGFVREIFLNEADPERTTTSAIPSNETMATKGHQRIEEILPVYGIFDYTAQIVMNELPRTFVGMIVAQHRLYTMVELFEFVHNVLDDEKALAPWSVFEVVSRLYYENEVALCIAFSDHKDLTLATLAMRSSHEVIVRQNAL